MLAGLEGSMGWRKSYIAIILSSAIACFGSLQAVTANALAQSSSKTSQEQTEIHISVKSSYILSVLRWESTLFLRVADCIATVKDDLLPVYYSGIIINGTRSENTKKLREILPSRGSVRISSYLPSRFFSDTKRMCGEFHGGSMWGLYRVKKSQFQIVE
jgi:hypothetical protein